VADPGAGELAPRDRLEVARHQRKPVALRLARERRERLGDAGRDERRQIGRAQALVCSHGGAGDIVRARVYRCLRDPGSSQQVARDRSVGPPGGLDQDPVEVDSVDLAGGVAQRRRVRVRGTDQQRAVDVPEQEQRGVQRRNETSALSFCANAAISFAVFSTSSIWTISTGECM